MPKPKIGRLQDEKLTGSRAYPPKAQGAPALRKTVINPPAMNSVAPPKVEGVRPERPTRKTQQVRNSSERFQPNRERLSDLIDRSRNRSVTNQVTRENELREPNRGVKKYVNQQRTRKTLEDAFRKQRNKK